MTAQNKLSLSLGPTHWLLCIFLGQEKKQSGECQQKVCNISKLSCWFSEERRGWSLCCCEKQPQLLWMKAFFIPCGWPITFLHPVVPVWRVSRARPLHISAPPDPETGFALDGLSGKTTHAAEERDFFCSRAGITDQARQDGAKRGLKVSSSLRST